MKDKRKMGLVYWRVIAPGCGAIALASVTSGMSTGPLAFAAGFGIGACVVGALAGIVTCVQRYKAA